MAESHGSRKGSRSQDWGCLFREAALPAIPVYKITLPAQIKSWLLVSGTTMRNMSVGFSRKSLWPLLSPLVMGDSRGSWDPLAGEGPKGFGGSLASELDEADNY